MNNLYISSEMLTAVTINITVFYPEYGGSRFLLNVTKFILGLHSVTLYSAQQLRTVTTSLKSFLVFLFLTPFYHIAYSPSNSMPCPNLSTETQFLVHTSNVLPPHPSIPKGPCAFPMWAALPTLFIASSSTKSRYGPQGRLSW